MSSLAAVMSFIDSMSSQSSSIVDISSPSPNRALPITPSQTFGTSASSPICGTSHSLSAHNGTSPLVASETFVDETAEDSDSSSAVFYTLNNTDTATNGAKKSANLKRKAKFKCTNCHTNFKSVEMLELHGNNCRAVALSSPADALQTNFCDICNRKFSSPRGVLNHKGKMHKGWNRQEVEQQNPPKNTGAKRGRGRPRKECVVPTPSVGTVQVGRKRSAAAAVLSAGEQQNETPLTDRRRRPKAPSGAAAVIHPKEAVQNPKLRKGGHSLKKEALAQQSGANKQRTNGTAGGGQRPRTWTVHGRGVPPPNGGQTQTDNGTHGQEADGSDDDDDIVILTPETKHGIVPRNAFGTVAPPPRQQQLVGPPSSSHSSPVIAHCAGMVINACAQSNLVTFHDVDTTRGTIGQITFQFMCNACRGQRGIARCYRGRAYCIMCCGHPECD